MTHETVCSTHHIIFGYTNIICAHHLSCFTDLALSDFILNPTNENLVDESLFRGAPVLLADQEAVSMGLPEKTKNTSSVRRCAQIDRAMSQI